MKRFLDQSAQALSSGADLIRHPEQAAELAQVAARSAGVAVGTLFKTPDPHSPLKGQLGIPKRVAWSEPVDLEMVKRCLLYTSDAADERSSVDLGGRRIIKKTTQIMNTGSVLGLHNTTV